MIYLKYIVLVTALLLVILSFCLAVHWLIVGNLLSLLSSLLISFIVINCLDYEIRQLM